MWLKLINLFSSLSFLTHSEQDKIIKRFHYFLESLEKLRQTPSSDNSNTFTEVFSTLLQMMETEGYQCEILPPLKPNIVIKKRIGCVILDPKTAVEMPHQWQENFINRFLE